MVSWLTTLNLPPYLTLVWHRSEMLVTCSWRHRQIVHEGVHVPRDNLSHDIQLPKICVFCMRDRQAFAYNKFMAISNILITRVYCKRKWGGEFYVNQVYLDEKSGSKRYRYVIRWKNTYWKTWWGLPLLSMNFKQGPITSLIKRGLECICRNMWF